jgi:hypothetical protein
MPAKNIERERRRTVEGKERNHFIIGSREKSISKN